MAIYVPPKLKIYCKSCGERTEHNIAGIVRNCYSYECTRCYRITILDEKEIRFWETI